MNIEVDSQDVIKIILQFLKENNLHKSMQALQEETNVSLNVVDNLDQLLSDIMNGRWNRVLQIVSSIGISSEALYDLFEQIFFELIEMDEIDSARHLLYNSAPLQSMKTDETHTIRYSRLEQIILHCHDEHAKRDIIHQLYGFDANHQLNSKEKRRKQIAENIEKQVFEASPSRLLSLINNALKYQQLCGKLVKGENYDLFRDYDKCGTVDKRDRNENIVRKNTCIIPFSKNSSMTFVSFSTDGNLLVSGSSDGFLEIWDYDTGKLIKDSNVLKFQSNDELLIHHENEPVRYITFSHDSQLMATGGDTGSIKIWKVYEGVNSIAFNDAHSSAITSLSFNKNGTQILSASLDKSIKIFGLKSKRILKEFHGHKSFVNKALYMNNDQSIISCSADGTIKIWCSKTTDCIHSIDNIQRLVPQNEMNAMKQYLNQQYGNNSKHGEELLASSSAQSANANVNQIANVSIRSIVANPMNKKTKQEEVYVVVNNCYIVYLLHVRTGKLIKKIESEKLKNHLLNKRNHHNTQQTAVNDVFDDHYFADIALSAYGHYLYALGEPDHILYCFNMLKKKSSKSNKKLDLLSHAIKLHDDNVVCIAHHPHRNILASISNDRKLKIWRP